MPCIVLELSCEDATEEHHTTLTTFSLALLPLGTAARFLQDPNLRQMELRSLVYDVQPPKPQSLNFAFMPQLSCLHYHQHEVAQQPAVCTQNTRFLRPT
jgi:hypothetical protein